MKDGFVKIAAVSPALIVGSPMANAERIISLMKDADAKGVKVLVFPELSITGYTASDLFFQETLLSAATRALDMIRDASADLDVLSFVGYPLEYGGKLYNTAAAVKDGRVLAYIPKTYLPTYGEFYETRWFTPAPRENIILETDDGEILFGSRVIIEAECPSSLRIAAEICEDLWVPDPPSTHHALAGATVLVNLSASDELAGKEEYRLNLVGNQSGRCIATYIYANASSGESSSDMVFTGCNVIAENGSILRNVSFSEDELVITETDVSWLSTEREKRNTYIHEDEGYDIVPVSFRIEETDLTRHIEARPFVPFNAKKRNERCERIMSLQAMGLVKRLRHTRCRSTVIGLSGGLDSTLALLVTVKAFDMMGLDRKGIQAVTMPCFGTTRRTRSNAEKLALALGVSFRTVDITKSVRQHLADIGQSEDVHNTTYENAQARERTQVLMDIANMTGGLVIGTGDLSELALGWATYNGDHMSMYGVNAGVPKTLVRHLVLYSADMAGDREVSEVLQDILDTPVSPELLPAKDGEISQVTEDLVGPYDLHDFFLYNIVRMGYTPSKTYRLALIAFDGMFDGAVIMKWLTVFIRRFFSQQFKRNCLPDGPKVGSVTLSPRSDWRMPSDADPSVWLEDLKKIQK